MALKANSEALLQKSQEKQVAQEQEIGKMARELEEAKKEAFRTYEKCIKKYKASDDFMNVVEKRAGEYHRMGYNDCLNFIRSGNTVDLNVHSFEVYLEKELGQLERGQEKVVGKDIGVGVVIKKNLEETEVVTRIVRNEKVAGEGYFKEEDVGEDAENLAKNSTNSSAEA